MNGNISQPVDTIDSVSFINLEDSDISPLMSEAQVKVLYLGQNRNHSSIDKAAALKMAKTLRGCPIVGAWRKDIEDFGDHGHVITIEDGDIKFACKTVPYGFVAPNARVWFQKFEDSDAFGNKVEREYLMTDAYLWTGQYEEARTVIEDGKGQSMEIDEETLDGKWATDSKTGMDFFIINDATFSKLCILGDDVEPCFEGASVTGVEGNFAKDAEFAHTLFSMMTELKNALNGIEGGLNMLNEQNAEDFTETSGNDEPIEQVEIAPEVQEDEPEQVETAEDGEAAEDTEESEESADAEFAMKKDRNDDDGTFESESESEKEDVPEHKNEDEHKDKDEHKSESAPEHKDEDKEDVVENSCGKKKYELEDSDIEAMRSEIEELRQFKLSIENKEKDALIAKYHMLSDEEKADIAARKEEYSLEQIDEKLALIYVKNHVDFSAVDGRQVEEKHEESLLNFSLDDTGNNDAEVVSDVQAAFRSMFE